MHYLLKLASKACLVYSWSIKDLYFQYKFCLFKRSTFSEVVGLVESRTSKWYFAWLGYLYVWGSYIVRSIKLYLPISPTWIVNACVSMCKVCYFLVNDTEERGLWKEVRKEEGKNEHFQSSTTLEWCLIETL